MGCGPRVGWRRRSSRYIVTSSVPVGTSTPSTRAMRSASRVARWVPRGRDAEQDEVGGALVALQQLVGDPGQRPGDVVGVEDGAGRSGARGPRGSRRPAGAPQGPDLLLRLTGRLVKGCRSRGTVAVGRPAPRGDEPTWHDRPVPLPRGLPGVLAVLMTAGWAANLFASVIPVLAEQEGFSTALLDAAFGAYAVALLPGLFGGGALSDRVGRAWVVLPGAALVVAGHAGADGVPRPCRTARWDGWWSASAPGSTFGAGTAWAGDLADTTGTVLAGVLLTDRLRRRAAGVGRAGPARPGPAGDARSCCRSRSRSPRSGGPRPPAPRRRAASATPAAGRCRRWSHHDARTALAWSLPVGCLVFAMRRAEHRHAAHPAAARGRRPAARGGRRRARPGQRHRRADRSPAPAPGGPGAGVAGALAAAPGSRWSPSAGSRSGCRCSRSRCVVLGTAYGLCLREGLLDVETLAPPARRGTLTGTFYVATYVGFGLPLLLTSLQPVAGTRLPAGAAGRARADRGRRTPRPAAHRASRTHRS